MKGQLEDEFKQMGFERTIILKPGLLMGPRNETRTAEWATQKIFRGLGAVGLPMKSLMIEAHEYVASPSPSRIVSRLASSRECCADRKGSASASRTVPHVPSPQARSS